MFAAFDRLTKSSPAVDKTPVWAMDFEHWCWQQCCFRDGWWTNVFVLYRDFCDWNIRRACDRQAFEDLLREAGFQIEVQREVAMVYGLVLALNLIGAPPEYLAPEEVERLRPRALDENSCLVIEIGEIGLENS